MGNKKIGILGGGHVGGTLARRFMEQGYDVRVGVPNPVDPKYSGLPTETPQSAAEFAEIVILATPWSHTEAAVQSILPQLDGKILVDATNPIAADFRGLTVGHQNSGGLMVASWAKGAKVVKAFNTIGFNIMQAPVIDGQPTTLCIAGDDPDAKASVAEIAQAIGFAPLDVGGLRQSTLTEAMAWLWISLSQKLGREFVFNLHRKESA